MKNLIIPGKAGKRSKPFFAWLTSVLLALTLMALYWGKRIYWLFVFFVVSVMLLSFLCVLLMRISLKPIFKNENITVTRGSNASIKLRVITRFPLLWGTVALIYKNPYKPRSEAVAFDMRQRRDLTYHVNFNAEYIGEYAAHIERVVLYDPFHIFHWSISPARAEKNKENNLLVLPRVEKVGLNLARPTGSQESQQIVQFKRSDDATVSSNRPYIHGDPLKRVNWKVSARLRKLHVKVSDDEETGRLHIYLGPVPQEGNALHLRQLVCEICASIANYYFEQGIRSICLHTHQNPDGKNFFRENGIYPILVYLARHSIIVPDINMQNIHQQLHNLSTLGTCVVVLNGDISTDTLSLISRLHRGSTAILPGADLPHGSLELFYQNNIQIFTPDINHPISVFLQKEVPYVQAGN